MDWKNALCIRNFICQLKNTAWGTKYALQKELWHVFWSHCHLFGQGISEGTQRKMRFHSACWRLCPKAHGGNFLNQMLCCGATVLQTKGSPNRLFQEMCSIWSMHDCWDLGLVYTCSLFLSYSSFVNPGVWINSVFPVPHSQRMQKGPTNSSRRLAFPSPSNQRLSIWGHSCWPFFFFLSPSNNYSSVKGGRGADLLPYSKSEKLTLSLSCQRNALLPNHSNPQTS